MNILRLTRHEPTAEQIKELHRIFGTCNVITVSETVPNAERVADLVEKYKADVLEVVLPPSLLANVLRVIKIPVIKAVMNRILKDNGGAEFVFSHYERIREIVVVTEAL
jgi:hypothetical protein